MSVQDVRTIEWALFALFLGYAIGRSHFYCPRCLHYLSWRKAMLRDVPAWPASDHALDTWERDTPPRARAAAK